ncbi:hypothetical protein D0860_02825 [Hortaea werneckii]|uniref:NADH dehydrogenase [ubiquinone] 1 alpha subcomplex subunit n=1 Tax=Hortaea werneckii TaxID=91943 RepID=A0A3M7HIL1_HORWE|nr:hypothetical protein D0860_02825 [Hortaea werneckii]
MSTLPRTLRNLRSIGLKEYGHQMQRGTFIGMDRYGNKYFENLEEELPRTSGWTRRDNRESEVLTGLSANTLGGLQEQGIRPIEPGWHAWMSYMVDKAPVDDKIMQRGVRHWEPAEHKPIMTATRSAFKTYSTTKNKYAPWQPVAAPRSSRA